MVQIINNDGVNLYFHKRREVQNSETNSHYVYSRTRCFLLSHDDTLILTVQLTSFFVNTSVLV